MSPLDRLLRRIVVTDDDCWRWTGVVAHRYGRIQIDGKGQTTHRVTYEHFVGPVPPGLELDHLCRNTLCVNPSHLEPVTHAENIRRGDLALGIRSAATHCKQGHEFTPENTVPRYRNGSVHRRCRKCRSRWVTESRRRRTQPTKDTL